MIKSEDISIVVQGAINKTETIKCLKSIRKYLPKGDTYKDARDLIYEEKNTFLTRGPMLS